MTRNLRSALLASAALSLAALTLAGCGSPGPYGAHGKDSYGATKTSSRTTYATPTVASTLAPAGSTTVVLPNGQPAVVASTVLVPTTTVNTTGSTVVIPSNQVPASTTILGSDIDFMARASQFNATEIAMSRIAYQRAQSSDVRAFARETIAMHRRMSDDLDSIALRRNVSLAWTPTPAGSTAINQLSNLSSWDVDRAYLAQIIADHQAASALYQSEGTQATDVTLRSTAAGNAVDLRNRLDEAVRLQQDID